MLLKMNIPSSATSVATYPNGDDSSLQERSCLRSGSYIGTFITLCPLFSGPDFLFLFIHTRTYIDHGGVHFSRFSCPQSARLQHVASSPSPSAQACPKKYKVRTKEATKEK